MAAAGGAGGARESRKRRIDKALAVLGDRPGQRAARPGELSLATGTPRLGDKVIEATGLVYSYDESGPLVLNGVDLDIGPGERLGVVGPNGIGKSTLLDLLAGRRQPNTGSIAVGSTVVVGYYDQLGVELDPTARVQDLVAGPNQASGTLSDIALMERFWFTGDLPFAPVGTLSGGERRRLQMLLVLAKRPNVLFLDEPTNNLDLDTISNPRRSSSRSGPARSSSSATTERSSIGPSTGSSGSTRRGPSRRLPVASLLGSTRQSAKARVVGPSLRRHAAL